MTSADGAARADFAAIPRWLRPLLRCPAGGHELADRRGAAGPELVCVTDCGAPGVRRVYRVDDGIPVLLLDEARVETSDRA